MSQLPLEIGTLVHDVLIQSLQLHFLTLAVVATLLALREVARPAPKLLQVSFKELGIVNLTPIAQSHVFLQTKVDACQYTSSIIEAEEILKKIKEGNS